MSDRAVYIRKAREKYDSYDSEEWIRAGFDEHTGGYMVFHIRHHFDPTIGIFGIPRGDYEKIASGVMIKYGMSVVLRSEKMEYDSKIPDGYLDGKRFDIKGIEGTGKNNIVNNLKDANKKNVETVVLYYYDKNIFSEQQIWESYQFYLRNSKNKRIQRVYYIVDGKLHTLK